MWHVLERFGDVLMCTPALRSLKACNPRGRIIFYTNFPQLVDGLPYIDSVRPSAEAPQELRIFPTYEQSIPPQRHLTRLFGDWLDVDIDDVRPDCVLDKGLRERFRREWARLPRPWIVISRKSGPWTPNKDWPAPLWEELVDGLLDRATVIEIGTNPPERRSRSEPNFVDLIGRTSLLELVAVIAAADLHVGPISGPVHVAAAFRVPSVVIYGGYEHPCGTSYEGNVSLYSPVPCAPCWLQTPCPYGKKCLHQIEPASVLAAVDQVWAAQDTNHHEPADTSPS